MPCSKNPILSPEPSRIQPRRTDNHRRAGDHSGNGRNPALQAPKPSESSPARAQLSFEVQQSALTLRIGRADGEFARGGRRV